MQIILLEKIKKLGSIGDVVKVKNGFGRNYLLPRKKAIAATESNLEKFAKMKSELELENKKRIDSAEKILSQVEGTSLVFIGQSGDDGRLYGSIGPKDIASRLSEEFGEKFNSSQIKLGAKIKDLGIHEVSVELHSEITATISLNVARSEEEARIAFEKKANQDLIKHEAKKKDSTNSQLPHPTEFSNQNAESNSDNQNEEGKYVGSETEETLDDPFGKEE